MISADSGTTRLLMRAFEDGGVVADGPEPATLHLHAAGDLVLTTGQIIACDPKWVGEGTQPFVQRVAPGRYPVTLSIAYFSDGDQRVAYASIELRPQPRPTHWALALRPGDDPRAASEGRAGYYLVDAGKGCFMDVEARQVWLQRLRDDPDYHLRINDALDRTYVSTWGWATLSLAPQTAATMVVFTSGYGDGGYFSYVGYDDEATLLCLTTDFALFAVDDEDEDEADTPW